MSNKTENASNSSNNCSTCFRLPFIVKRAMGGLDQDVRNRTSGEESELKTATERTRKRAMSPAGASHAVMTIRDAAAFLHCHTSTLYRLVKRGEIPAFRLGGGWRLTWDSLERWMRENQGTI